MDKDAEPALRDPVICVTGLVHEIVEPGGPACDPSVYLKVKKSRKFMGVQDDLAVACAGRALSSAGLSGAPLGERTGLYLAVGYIPFQEADIGPVLDASTEGGRFAMRRFAEEGYLKAHPLLTFRCLPNMPAYHVSVNFDVQGPYLVTYPGPGQLYTALEEAVFALREGRIDVALVGGVAHQRNFLVEHHFRRIDPPVPAELLRDAGAMMVLETEERARERRALIRGRLQALSVGYQSFDPLAPARHLSESLSVQDAGNSGSLPTSSMEAGSGLGPCSLLCALNEAWSGFAPQAAVVRHTLVSRDGIRGESVWARGGAGA